MASATVVSVFLVCGLVKGYDHGVQRSVVTETSTVSSIPTPEGHFVKATARTNFIPFNSPGQPSKKPQENSSLVSRDGKEKQLQLQRRIGFNQEEIYPLLIPIKFGVNPDRLYPEQRSRSRSVHPESSRIDPTNPPRLIMDKDFNIRFDNPYIVPVSKPLAFVLDSSVAGRTVGDGPYGNKMMIPFPVLVQSRNPLPQEGRYRDYRGPEEYVEHRGNTDDEFYTGESYGRHPPRKPSSYRKSRKNSTSPYTETTSPESVRTDPTEEDAFDVSSDGPNVYPSKIFEDMYRNMPKYHVDSQESRERERPYGDTRRKFFENKETSSLPTKEPTKQRQKARPTVKYSYSRQPVFSATSDLEWVTHVNSTTSKKTSHSGEKVKSRTVAKETTTTTTKPLQGPHQGLFHQSTTISPSDVQINKQYWRDI